MPNSISGVAALAGASKLTRFLHHPARYGEFILKSKLLPKTGLRKSSLVEAQTFWGEKMHVSLPSSSDIFLNGGKTHSSEIRLAKWLIENIGHYEKFIDIGAHVGYFSLLASHISQGKLSIQCFEPSRSAFALLRENTSAHSNITVHQVAVGAADGEATFHEFPHQHAEYSSLVMDNYEGNLRETLQKESMDYAVPVRTLKDIVSGRKTLLKIDTEGNELAVLEGAGELLQKGNCDFVIEFLSNGNETYPQAEKLLRKAGFRGFLLDEKGDAVAHESVVGYMAAQGLESENVLWKK